MRPLQLSASVVAAVVATVGFAVSSPAQAAAPVQISQGHVDAVDVGYESGNLELSIHDETVTPDVERDPADVVLVAKPEAKIAVPADSSYRFLGRPGATVWVLPEVQDPNLLWAGLSTEEIEPGVFKSDSISINFKKFVGPDGVSLFTTDAGGRAVVLADSEDPCPDIIKLPAGTHQHVNWGFEKAGTYKITVQATARLASNNRKVTSDPATLTFRVKP